MEALILSCGTGGGHNAAGKAIEDELILRGHKAVMINPYNLAGDKLPKRVDGAYIKLATDAPNAFGLMYSLGQAVRRLPGSSPIYWANGLMAQRMEEYLSAHNYDVVIMPHLFPAEILTFLKRRGKRVPKMVFIATDYSCIPFTEETDCDYFVIPSSLLKEDFIRRGIPEDKLLVSNDIFGQNIASSARFVDEFGDDGEYTRRVKEYYFNIVLPYSPMVLKTLPVVEKLDIDMIAPDHGLIQRGEKAVRGIIDMYRAMAEQKPQQRALIFYDTMWESTETMAYAICSGLEENNVPTRIMSVKQNHHSAVMTELADCGAVIAGSPTHNNTVLPLMAAQLTYMKGLRPLNRIGGAFGSYGWSGEGPKFLHEQLASMNMEMPAEPVKCNWRPDHEALKACHQMGVTIAEALKKKCQG